MNESHAMQIGLKNRLKNFPGARLLAASFVTASFMVSAQVPLPLEVVAGFEPTETPAPTAGVGGIKGKRPSKKDKLRAASLQSES